MEPLTHMRRKVGDPGVSRITNLTRTAASTMAMPAALAITLLAGTASQAQAVEFSKPKAVIELFTSQGCSSCPPADKALKEINSETDILGLALHVDYWDRLGWKDTFASPDNTKRQWSYARALGERQVYTPQAVVNGRTHLVGSRKEQLLETSNTFANGEEGLVVPVELTRNGDTISVRVAPTPQSMHSTLYVYYFNPVADVEIGRGENAGRTITYSNIVGRMDMVGMVGEAGITSQFAINDMRSKGYKACALILQHNTDDGYPGPIIGASVIHDL